MKVNLGCGKDIKKGYINIDFENLPGVDIIHDLNKNIPLDDNTVDELYTSHFLEHIDNLYNIMDEIHRVCKHGSKVIIKVPHFTVNTYEFHLRNFRYNSLENYDINSDKTEFGKGRPQFKILKRKLCFGGIYKPFGFLSKIPYVYENTFLRSFIFCTEVYIEMQTIKTNEP